MENLADYITYYLNRLNGPESDDAFHSIIEAPREAIPLLVEAYQAEEYSSCRGSIVEAISQFKDANIIPFLSEALLHDQEEIWKHALDGLVSLARLSEIVFKQSKKRNEYNSLWTCQAMT